VPGENEQNKLGRPGSDLNNRSEDPLGPVDTSLVDTPQLKSGLRISRLSTAGVLAKEGDQQDRNVHRKKTVPPRVESARAAGTSYVVDQETGEILMVDSMAAFQLMEAEPGGERDQEELVEMEESEDEEQVIVTHNYVVWDPLSDQNTAPECGLTSR
jgi:hypothetical protein